MKFMSISGSGSGRILGSRIPDIRPDIQGGGQKKLLFQFYYVGHKRLKALKFSSYIIASKKKTFKFKTIEKKNTCK